MIAVGVILLMSIIIVMIAPRFAARRVMGSRERLADDRLVGLFSGSTQLPTETVLMVLRSVGAGYGINYSELRPSDCLISQLSKIDSWRFDAGAEKLGELLSEKYGICMPANAQSFTLLDLMKLIEGSIQRTPSVSGF